MRIKVVAIGVFFVMVFVGMLYYTIKTKTRNLDNLDPFKEWIGKRATLNEKVYLFEDISGMAKEKTKDYPYKFIREADRNSNSFNNLLQADPPYYKIIDSLPKGTIIHFDHSKIFTNGVSGGSQIFLYCTLNHQGNEIKALYPWGENMLSRIYEKEEKTWKFPLAPWQHHEDVDFYKIPDGIW